MKNKKHILLLPLALTAALLFLCSCSDALTGDADIKDSILLEDDDPEDSEKGMTVTPPAIIEDTTRAESTEREETEADTEPAEETTGEKKPQVQTERPAALTTAVSERPQKPEVSESATANTEKPETEEPKPEEITNITEGGEYSFSGVKTDICITVDAPDKEVRLILNGVTVGNKNGPAIYVREAKKVEIYLAKGSENTLWDGEGYSVVDSGSLLDGAVFSKADLSIKGEGSLAVYGCYKHGIVSKDKLIINSGNINVTAANVGISGKDCVKLNGADVNIISGTDGIRSKNTESLDRGYVEINGGSITVEAGSDGVQASSTVSINGGRGHIKAGKALGQESSCKGLKAAGEVNINGGDLTVYSYDDAVHSNACINVTKGRILAAGASGAKQTVASKGQGALLIDADDRVAGTLLSVKDKDGNTVAEFTPEIDYKVLFITDSTVLSGEVYTVFVDSSKGEFAAK